MLDVLPAIAEDRDLKTRVALKGGSALNVFHLRLDRLSVDIDLNHVGAVDRAAMEADRPLVDEALLRLLEAQGLPRPPPAAGPRRRRMGGPLHISLGRRRNPRGRSQRHGPRTSIWRPIHVVHTTWRGDSDGHPVSTCMSWWPASRSPCSTNGRREICSTRGGCWKPKPSS